MSGGIAYVFDEDGLFEQTRCNKAGVDLEPIFDDQDIVTLRSLIQKHVDYTGSPRGKWFLENWTETLPRFVKVFPHEYKRVLGIARSAETVKIAPQLARLEKSVRAAQGGAR
jgi:glutamate synthase domain-containing protein 3